MVYTLTSHKTDRKNKQKSQSTYLLLAFTFIGSVCISEMGLRTAAG